MRNFSLRSAHNSPQRRTGAQFLPKEGSVQLLSEEDYTELLPGEDFVRLCHVRVRTCARVCARVRACTRVRVRARDFSEREEMSRDLK